MSPLDAFWHLVNLFAPAVFLAVFSASVVKLVWRREWRGVAWRSLLTWALIPTLTAAIGGLALTGRDGKMVTYLAMVVASALGLWLAGLFHRNR